MTTNPRLERLKAYGDPRPMNGWPEKDPDYVELFGLRPSDVPALIDITQSWFDDEEWVDDEREPDPIVYAPVHAWRALAQLRASEAVPVLLDMLDPMDAGEDDWHLGDFPQAFAVIGPPAFDLVADYLDDDSHAEYSRACAADGLCHIAQSHPDLRDAAVRRLMRQLSTYERSPCDLNSLVTLDLLKLRATEAAELIERAFAAGRIDESIIGDWGDVREELGVEGIGLAPLRRTPKQPSFGVPRIADDGLPRTARKFKSRKTAKRQQQRKARKRGRGR